MAAREAWFQFENNLLDSQDGNDMAVQGTTSSFSTSIVKRGTYSRQYDGVSYDQKAATLGGIPSSGAVDISFGGFFYSGTASNVESWCGLGVTSSNANRCIWPTKTSATNIRVDLASDLVNFTVAISNATWYWLWVEHEAATKKTAMYIDNVITASGTLTHANPINLEATQHLNMGADADGNNIIKGNLDHWQFWSGVTTAADRASIFNDAILASRTLLGVG
jgi:hypothetical protein